LSVKLRPDVLVALKLEEDDSVKTVFNLKDEESSSEEDDES